MLSIFQMRVGERAEIEIPPEYAYGAEGYPPVYPFYPNSFFIVVFYPKILSLAH